MLTISGVKSLLSLSSSRYKPPAAAAAAAAAASRLPCISRRKAESLQVLCFLPALYVITPLPNFFKPSNCSQSRGLCTVGEATDEILVIVGPMFAGKTTTLLKRIKSKSINGRFQAAESGKNYYHLDKTLKDLCFTGRIKEAVRLLCCSGVKVHSATYCLLLQECIFRKEYRKGRMIHWQMVAVGFVPDEYLNIKLLILYAKAGDLDTAHNFFYFFSYHNLVSWNAMIAGYVQKGQEEVALSFYGRMRLCGLVPDQYTFASVFRAFSSLAILEQGKQAHGLLIKSQFSKNIVVCTSLMDMYFKCSCSYDAFLVFDKCLERNVVTWTALISGYGLNGRVVEVLSFFHQMIDEGFRPNQITFLAVLSACSHGGLVDEGREYFSSMIRDYGVKPSGRHYAVIVDLLGRGGRLEEAYAFVQTSPFKKHPAVWGALLGACKIHGNVEMVKLAAKKFFELEPENAGKYIVLCNAYATFGLWDNVAEIRSMMKGCGIKKEPGYSMVEVQMEAHFFFMGHNTHKQTKQICGLIEDMTCILKDNCDVLDFSIELE